MIMTVGELETNFDEKEVIIKKDMVKIAAEEMTMLTGWSIVHELFVLFFLDEIPVNVTLSTGQYTAFLSGITVLKNDAYEL